MLVDFWSVDWLKVFRDYGLCVRAKRQKRNKGAEVLNMYCAFDIETSTIHNSDVNTDAHSFMYVWQYQIEDYLIKGRTWDEWFSLLDCLKKALTEYGTEQKLLKTPYLVTWIHNASYEFSFISGLYQFKDDECFFRDIRKPIYFRMFECFEYRCSYIQTNLSLLALTKQTGVPMKLSGQKFDYSKVRFPWTELSEYEESYTTTDVESLVKAMKVRIQKGGDNLLTAPLTSTGYVRRECKASLKDRYLQINEMKPYKGENGIRIYRLLRSAFRGGNTHANRYHVGKICSDNTKISNETFQVVGR